MNHKRKKNHFFPILPHLVLSSIAGASNYKSVAFAQESSKEMFLNAFASIDSTEISAFYFFLIDHLGR